MVSSTAVYCSEDINSSAVIIPEEISLWQDYSKQSSNVIQLLQWFFAWQDYLEQLSNAISPIAVPVRREETVVIIGDLRAHNVISTIHDEERTEKKRMKVQEYWPLFLERIIAHKETTSAITAPQRERQSNITIDTIITSLENEPLEDGFCHPAEELLAALLERRPKETIGEIKSLLKTGNPSIAADLLRCIGRLDIKLCRGQWQEIVEIALGHSDIDVRDAAVQAIETWEAIEAEGILGRWAKKEKVSWLRDYMDGVLTDLRRIRRRIEN